MRRIQLCVSVLILFGATAVQADHHEEGFVSIFDGKTLDGWDGNPKFWSVQEGAITGKTTPENPTKGNTFIIWRKKEVSNFELRLKYKIVGGNSGIQYRSQDHGNWVAGGYQADIDSKDTYSGINYDERGRGILALRGEMVVWNPKKTVLGSLGDSKEINSVIKKEDWNDYTIIAHGSQLIHIINGRITSQTIDSDEENAEASGILAFQLHQGPPMTVQFKDIRIRMHD